MNGKEDKKKKSKIFSLMPKHNLATIGETLESIDRSLKTLVLFKEKKYELSAESLLKEKERKNKL